MYYGEIVEGASGKRTTAHTPKNTMVRHAYGLSLTDGLFAEDWILATAIGLIVSHCESGRVFREILQFF